MERTCPQCGRPCPANIEKNDAVFVQCPVCFARPQQESERGGFQKELKTLLNRHSKENASNTPDFILARYLCACLAAWDEAVQRREAWYGRDARPSEPGSVLAKP